MCFARLNFGFSETLALKLSGFPCELQVLHIRARKTLKIMATIC